MGDCHDCGRPCCAGKRISGWAATRLGVEPPPRRTSGRFGGANPSTVSEGGRYHPERRQRQGDSSGRSAGRGAGVPPTARIRSSEDGRQWSETTAGTPAGARAVSGWASQRIGQAATTRNPRTTRLAALGLQRLNEAWMHTSEIVCGRRGGPCGEGTYAGAHMGPVWRAEFEKARTDFLNWKRDTRASVVDLEEIRQWGRELAHFVADVGPTVQLDRHDGVDPRNQGKQILNFLQDALAEVQNLGEQISTATQQQPSRSSVSGYQLNPRSGRSGWVRARIGQVTTDDLQARVDSLDRDWNALRTAVCGSARGLCMGGASAQLGASWVQAFETSIGDWRSWRDDFRQRWMTWGISDGHEIDRWRDELTRYRGDVEHVTGVDPVPSAQEAPEGALDQLGHVAADVARNTATGIGAGAGLGIVVALIAAAMLGRH